MAAIHGKLGDVLPGRGDRRAQDIGGEGKFEGEQDPGGEAEPDLAASQLIGGLAEEKTLSTPPMAWDRAEDLRRSPHRTR